MAAWLNCFDSYLVSPFTSDSGNGFSYSLHRPTCWAALFQSCGQPTMPRLPIASLSIRRGAGILTCCPSPTPLGLGLGPTNPTRINLPSETLDLRRTCFSHVSRYSCQHSHFCTLHCSSRYSFYAVQNAPLPQLKFPSTARSFGIRLEPRYILRAETFDQ